MKFNGNDARIRWILTLSILALAAIAGGWSWIATEDKMRMIRNEIREAEQRDLGENGTRLSDGLMQIYQNLRTISFLPDVRHQTYQANQANAEVSTIQQIYNNLASNVEVSEVYLTKADFDPNRVDPATGETEVPALMLDQLITGDAKAQAGVQEVDVKEQPEREDQEYPLIARQIAYFKQHYPTRTSFDMLNAPILAGEDVITCDNTEFNKTLNDSDRMGVVFSVPYYLTDGKLGGVVSAIIRNNVLRRLLPAKNAALSVPALMLSVSAEDAGVADSAAARSGIEDKTLFFSGAHDLKFPDPTAKWLLWQGVQTLDVEADSRIQSIRTGRLYAEIAIVVIGLVSLLLLHWVHRRFVAPASALAEAVVSISRGDLDKRPPHADRQDLLGEISRAVNGFRRNAILVQQADEERVRLAEEAETMRRLEAERAYQEQAHKISTSVGAAISRLAAGDLKARVNVDLGPGFGSLREDFNSACEKLGDVLSKILVGTHLLTGEVASISSATRDLANRTFSQVDILNAAGRMLAEITDTVNQQNDLSEDIAGAMNTARSKVGEGQSIASLAVSSINRVASSTRQIRDFTAIIDEIAVQTNMLALNAGIEAARAGEHGRGFALVASEVRTLAHKASDAAREIRHLVDTSAVDVDAGVTSITQTDETLQSILTAIDQAGAVSGSIGENAGHQNRRIAEINSLVDELNMMSQKNAAMVEQSSQATDVLAEQIARLRDLTAYFQADYAAGKKARAA